jgi:hypothetical protein
MASKLGSPCQMDARFGKSLAEARVAHVKAARNGDVVDPRRAHAN